MRHKLHKFTFPIFICLLLLISNGNAQDSYEEKSIDVALRMIGHQLLLSSNDSTSRVLPISRENNTYRIQFESEFEFKPVELVAIIDSVITEADIPSEYIVEVGECETGEVVYSFKMDDLEQSDIIPCGVRMQPKACYSLVFTFMTNDSDIASLSVTPVISPMNYGLIAGALLLGAGLFFFLWKRRKSANKNPNLIALGEYHFDKRNTELLINHQKIELTSKEADLLLLLYNMVNTTVEREVILNKVWGDQGDYVGRTLDVFISKLRKKLEADSSVKIANIRGVGYKLVMEV
ncbi:winged helix-turn-helix domain-containing protein [Maribacter sp. 2308TA10-17]|uniref:winged helix-turn-helix domain-containing protein n=1 Tax=Maribacter sp. 2308TA10-17 TaxID=3386276 RepID=UPI0039BC56B9